MTAFIPLSEDRKIRVLLVDDSAIFLKSAANLLRQHEEICVVGAAGGAEEALRLAPTLRPDVILLDIAMPGMPGLTAIPYFREAVPAAKIVIVSVGDESIYRPAVLKANADDFVSKSKLSADLLSAIRRAIGRQ